MTRSLKIAQALHDANSIILRAEEELKTFLKHSRQQNIFWFPELNIHQTAFKVANHLVTFTNSSEYPLSNTMQKKLDVTIATYLAIAQSEFYPRHCYRFSIN